MFKMIPLILTKDILYLLLGGVGVCLVLREFLRLFSVKLDPREPPIVEPTIPFIGHIWGLMRHSHNYLSIVQ
jgi:hypothetical protein